VSSESALAGNEELTKSTETKHIILNALLAYLSYYRDRSTKEALFRVVMSCFFSSAEISADK